MPEQLINIRDEATRLVAVMNDHLDAEILSDAIDKFGRDLGGIIFETAMGYDPRNLSKITTPRGY